MVMLSLKGTKIARENTRNSRENLLSPTSCCSLILRAAALRRRGACAAGKVADMNPSPITRRHCGTVCAFTQSRGAGPAETGHTACTPLRGHEHGAPLGRSCPRRHKARSTSVRGGSSAHASPHLPKCHFLASLPSATQDPPTLQQSPGWDVSPLPCSPQTALQSRRSG